MNYSGNIVVKEDSNNIFTLFESETKEFDNNRASYSIKKKGANTEFFVSAKDATALRAVLNSIVKNLVVYEKVKNEQGN